MKRILEGGIEEGVRWWVTTPFERDSFCLFMVRYQTRINEDKSMDVLKQEYLAKTGQWVSYNDFDIIEPAIEFPGVLVLYLSEANLIDKSSVAKSLMNLADKILSNDG